MIPAYISVIMANEISAIDWWIIC